MNIKDLVIVEKPDNISYESIRKLLNKAHETNKEEGLHYGSADLTADRLKEKITDNGKCFVAIYGSELVGTGTVRLRQTKSWFYHGNVAYLELIGVDPQYKGMHIASAILDRLLIYSQKQNVPIVMSSSAEKNTRIRQLYLSHGFKKVGYASYQKNDFYSIVYAKWFNDCPFSNRNIARHYLIRKLHTIIRYKKGGKKRIM